MSIIYNALPAVDTFFFLRYKKVFLCLSKISSVMQSFIMICWNMSVIP